MVAVEAALLRDNPSPDSGILTQLTRSDQVEYLESNASGWWKVRSLRTGVVGWMTSDLLTAVAPAPPPSSQPCPEYFYVNTVNIDLHSLPLYSSTVTGSVQLNDRLEKLGTSPKGWTKVRNPRKDKKGWLPTCYLSEKIVTSPLPAPQTPKKRVKRTPPSKGKKQVEQKAPVLERPKPM